MTTLPLKRVLSGPLTFLFFATNVAWTHAAEGNFWPERRRAADRVKETPLLAHMPQLPAVKPAATLALGAPALASPDQPAKELALLPPLPPFATLRELRLSSNPGAPVVVHLQDAHGVEEAQLNTSRMIEALSRQSPGIVIGLEGATGPFEVDAYRDY